MTDKNRIDDTVTEQVNGGAKKNAGSTTHSPVRTVEHFCKYCNTKRTFNVYSGGQAVCQTCNTQTTI